MTTATARKFIAATAQNPCPICKAEKRCSVTADGRKAVCYKVSEGAKRTKTDRQGSAYYVHEHPDTPLPGKVSEQLPTPTDRIASTDDRHRVYSELLRLCRLTESHRQALKTRGLAEADINSRKYGSQPEKPWKIARKLREQFTADVLIQIPGIVVKNKEGRDYLSIYSPPGLLVPCRDTQGRIFALKVRPDRDTGGGKYRFLSSASCGGPKAEMGPHIPLRAKSDKPIQGPLNEARVTEGELKADVSTVHSDVPTISVPGVGNWRGVVPSLQELGVQEVLLAFDADAESNREVARHLLECRSGLAAEGFKVILERWPAEDGKGVDDLLSRGGIPDRLQGGEEAEFLDRLASLAEKPAAPPAETGTKAIIADSLSRPRLAPGTMVRPVDRGNIGEVLSDDGEMILVRFTSVEGQTAEKEFSPDELRFQDGRQLVGKPIQFELIDSKSFDEADYRVQFLIRKILVAGQPAILGGAQKTLKTSLALDLILSLGTGSPFLGQFEVPRIVPVGILSGESGGFTLQETARRIAHSKNVSLRDAAVHWGFALPQLGLSSHLNALAEIIEERKLEAMVIDPAYLCMLQTDDGQPINFANMFSVGSVLLNVSETFAAVNCTPIILHHESKSAQGFRTKGGNWGPPELQDLSMSGFAEWARQWLLVSRREAYEHGSGLHKFWLNAGGSAGHGGLWAVDVDEGQLQDDFTGRHWQVTVATSTSERKTRATESEVRKTARQRERDDADRGKLMQAYREVFPQGETAKQLRGAAGLSGDRFTFLNTQLLAEGVVESFLIKKAGVDRDAYRLKPSGKLFDEGENLRDLVSTGDAGDAGENPG